MPSGVRKTRYSSDTGFSREGNQVRIETRVGDHDYYALVDYAFGSDKKELTLAGPDDGGQMRQLRLSHDTDGQLWDVTTGLSPRPEADEHYAGDPLSEADTRCCFSCHVTVERAARDRKGPASADRGIGCERRHGPGEHHILAVNARFPDMAIAEPGKPSGPQAVRLRAQCHSIRGLVTPNIPAVVRVPGTTLTWSRRDTESNGALGCTSRHDPHRDVSTSASYYEAGCLGRHAPQPADKTPGTEGSGASTCPVNAVKGCVECHMPKVRTAIPRSIFTDHHIRVHRAQDETE